MTDGSIYFARCGESVKIGFSKNPASRLKELSIGMPIEPELVGVHPGSQRDEKRLHKMFAAHHQRGEWFRWVPEIEAIARNGLGTEHRAQLLAPSAAQKAAELAIKAAGGCEAVAKQVRERTGDATFTRQAVRHWIRSKHGVPPHHVLLGRTSIRLLFHVNPQSLGRWPEFAGRAPLPRLATKYDRERET